MADIQLRFNKDMLVLSTPFFVTLERFGYEQEDRDYAILCESEIVEESFKFETMAQTPVFILPTETITNARLMHSRFEGNAAVMAKNCYEAAQACNPQHILAAIESCNLPLDESSKASLKQSFNQYKSAVQALAEYPLDGILFTSFENAYDAQCALMGARSVYDGPLFVSFKLDQNAELKSQSHSLIEASKLALDSGADVIGISSDLPEDKLCNIAKSLSKLEAPLLFEIEVKEVNKRQAFPSSENPYPRADLLVDTALKLRCCGVQFLRATGNASPSYTGSLAAVLNGLDVVLGA